MTPFVKTQALGNDFLLVEQSASLPHDYADLATRICDRNFGVGADGLIIWAPGDGRIHMRIFNRDGSEAECSGNGLRCLAAYMIESDKWRGNEIRIETMSGSYVLRRVGKQYEADMGTPQLVPAEIPFIPPRPMDRVVNCPLEVEGETIAITACSTGNPHCSVFVDNGDESEVQRIGPMLEHHPRFPKRTNVEFIRVRNRGEIDVQFWERGVGMTFASGTGSCGAAVAGILNDKTDRHVTVHTKTGRLEVEWLENGRLKLTSTAQVVAEGNYLGA